MLEMESLVDPRPNEHSSSRSQNDVDSDISRDQPFQASWMEVEQEKCGFSSPFRANGKSMMIFV
jgi:hypothetical protein